MRNAFADELTKLAIQDPRVVLLSGDIGNKLFDTFKEKCGDRFLNCGVAEANMISMAAGLASEGFRPVAYTITPFITYRALEQIRIDLCYHRQAVTVVGVGSGLGYTSLGATHHSLEEIAALRALPEMTILCPGDPKEVRGALNAAIGVDGPVYIRLGKKGEPVLHKDTPHFKVGHPLQLSSGSDVCLLACGTILADAMKVAELLQSSGISASVYSFHTVKPLPKQFLDEVFRMHSHVVTIEEHSLQGGVGSAVGEWIIDHAPSFATKLLRIGTPDEFLHYGGEREFAMEAWGLSPEAMSKTIIKHRGR